MEKKVRYFLYSLIRWVTIMMSILATKFNLGTVGGGTLISAVVVVVNFVSCSPSDGEHWEAGYALVEATDGYFALSAIDQGSLDEISLWFCDLSPPF